MHNYMDGKFLHKIISDKCVHAQLHIQRIQEFSSMKFQKPQFKYDVSRYPLPLISLNESSSTNLCHTPANLSGLFPGANC